MKALDLFAGAQGSSVGYARAGFEVTAVDIERHDRHPEVHQFYVDDAMEVLREPLDLAGYAVIHAGPPCQGYTTMNRWRGKTANADLTPKLIHEVRELLREWAELSGGTYVLENVTGARAHMVRPILLRGGMFGLGVDRPRLFESNAPLTPPAHARAIDPVGVYGPLDGRRLTQRKDGSWYHAAKTLDQAQAAMGIDWMAWHDLTEAIPPAYTEYIGRQITAPPVAPTAAHTTGVRAGDPR